MIKKIIIFGLIIFLVIAGYNFLINQPTNTMKDAVKKNLPFPLINIKKQYNATFETSAGTIKVELYSEKTPITVSNFVFLANKNFYNNTIFHRVINGFMIQGGDPVGNGTGGPGYKFDDESFVEEYSRGTLAMANSTQHQRQPIFYHA